MSSEKVVSFKGFDAEFKCRGFQYEVGATYTHNGAVAACESGFHACANPFDVLTYYPLFDANARPNRFAIVEQFGKLNRQGGDTKIASASITVTAELAIPEFIKHAVTWMIDHCTKNVKESKTAASGDDSQLAASGYGSQLAASGDSSQLAASGENSVIASSSNGGTAKGVPGTWIALAEYDRDGKCIGFATGCIGVGGLEPDTFYRACGGKLVKA